MAGLGSAVNAVRLVMQQPCAFYLVFLSLVQLNIGSECVKLMFGVCTLPDLQLQRQRESQKKGREWYAMQNKSHIATILDARD